MVFKKGSAAVTPFTLSRIYYHHVGLVTGCTVIVNLSTIDLSKAFDKVNHDALFIKLMKRHIPVQLLEVLENLFRSCNSCVKWNGVLSYVIKINLGVRQRYVLSPFLFCLYLDDFSKLPNSFRGYYIVMYADDVWLLSPSVTLLQKLYMFVNVS